MALPFNLDLDVLRTFVTGLDLGSYAKAAGRLGRSQSAISLQLRKLEETTGQTLLRKQGRGLALTPEGEIMLGYARRLLELNDEMQSRFQQWEGGLLSRQLSQNYSDYRFFAVSALGAPPVEEEVAAHGVSPFRVEDPVLWLLAREGMIPTQRAKP